jgi:hypothetical protein
LVNDSSGSGSLCCDIGKTVYSLLVHTVISPSQYKITTSQLLLVENLVCQYFVLLMFEERILFLYALIILISSEKVKI